MNILGSVGLDKGLEDLGDLALEGQVLAGDHLRAQTLQAHVLDGGDVAVLVVDHALGGAVPVLVPQVHVAPLVQQQLHDLVLKVFHADGSMQRGRALNVGSVHSGTADHKELDNVVRRKQVSHLVSAFVEDVLRLEAVVLRRR